MTLRTYFTTAVPFVLDRTRQHSYVESAEALDEYRIGVKRADFGGGAELPDVTVVAVSKQVLTRTDVERILSAHADIDGVVNSGKGLHYLGEAKRRANDAGVAVHTFREYLSALGDQSFRTSEDKTVRWALEAFGRHRRVVQAERLCERRIRLRRDGLSVVEFVPESIYTLGIADLDRILGEHPGLQAIVNTSSWTQYTAEAKARAIEYGVGLFNTKEMFGALNFDGDAFVKYPTGTTS